MKYYSKKIIQDYIETNKDKLESVDVGMQEDWSWTCERIWNIKYGYNSCFKSDNDRIEVAGIDGSRWATPIMRVYFKNSGTEVVKCYTEDGVSENSAEIARMKAFAAATGGMDFVC